MNKSVEKNNLLELKNINLTIIQFSDLFVVAGNRTDSETWYRYRYRTQILNFNFKDTLGIQATYSWIFLHALDLHKYTQWGRGGQR